MSEELLATARCVDVAAEIEALGRGRARRHWLANDGDRVITSDPDDLAPLARAADLDIDLVTP